MDGAGRGGSLGLPPFALYPSSQGSYKGKEGQLEEGLKDLIRWTSRGRFHYYGGILSGGFLPEGAGAPEEETALIESRKGELCAATMESVEIGWSLLKGLGAPAEIPLAGPNPIPADFDLEVFLTRTLDTLGALNKWCEQGGGRFTAICPECTAGACWFCARHKGCLCCEICEWKTDLSGDWVDGTRLVDDSLSLDYHATDMGSFLISEIKGVRLADKPRSDAPHDCLEFVGLVRGWQPEERQKWISELSEDQGQRRECNDEVLLERLWLARNVRPILLPTRWWPRTLEPMALPRVGGEMLGFSNEAQGWLPCKIVESAPQEKLWTVDWWDNSQEDRTKGEEGLCPFEETGWWYRIVQKTCAKRYLHCQNTDGTYGRWRTEAEWHPKDWTELRGNTRCKECRQQGLGHDEEQERPHGEGKRSKERRRESPHQTVLICQPTDARLKGDDRYNLGTVTLTAKDLRRILTHGQHFPFFTAKEREEGGAGHWETRAWETCDIEVWDTTADLGFPVTKDKDIVKSARDAAEDRRTNFIISPEILRFSRQVLEKEAPEEEPNECIRTLRELVSQ